MPGSYTKIQNPAFLTLIMKRYASLLKYFKPYKGNIVLYFLFTLLSVVFGIVSISMLIPFLDILFHPEKRVTDLKIFKFNAESILHNLSYYLTRIINEQGIMPALTYICLTIITAVFLKNLFLYLSYYVLSPMRNSVMTRLRNDLYNKILSLPIGYFTEQRKGDLISRMTNDTWELEGTVMNTMEGLIKEPLTIILILGTLIFLSPHLSIFLLVFLPLTGFIIGRVSRSLKKQSNAAAIKSGEEHILRNKFLSTNDALFHVKNKMNYRRDLASPMSEFLGVLVLCGILWFGTRLVLGSENFALQPNSFIGYIALFTQIINPSKTLSSAFYNMQRGSAAIARIEEILKAPLVVTEIASPKILLNFKQQIEFRKVGFAYDDAVILKNINLIIKKGKTIALVGSSGAGKSTLADLVPRFHDVTFGELFIDGIDIKEYSLHSIRNQISIVTQEPILFNDTIFNNIALGKENATEEQVVEAAKIANAHSFIEKKENGYQTNIGDRGSKLSGGERQRVTIARAVLKNPPILILDEATSSLDTESERLVQDAINKMMKNRTSIVIAHRLSTIRHADEIIVMQKGEIVERGNHAELMAQDKYYRRLVDMQEVK